MQKETIIWCSAIREKGSEIVYQVCFEYNRGQSEERRRKR